MEKKKPTIKTLAAELGISPTTVSFVLNGRDKGIKPETAERIIRTACRMGYTRSSRMHMREWRRIAYVTNNISQLSDKTTFYQEVYNHLQRLGTPRHLETVMRELDVSASPQTFFRQYEALIRQDFDAFITHNRRIAAMLREKDAKVILSQGGEISNCICIYCDDLGAGKAAALHALEMGHRSAGTVFFDSCSTHPRFYGFSEQFLKSGGNMPDKFCWTVPDDHEKAAAVLADKLSNTRGRRPTFFYCFADNLVFPLLRACAACGVRVPDDLSIMGTDNLYWGKISSPAFSTIDLQEEVFAERLIMALEEMSKGYTPYQLAVPVRLLPRETVKKLD